MLNSRNNTAELTWNFWLLGTLLVDVSDKFGSCSFIP